MRFPGRVIESAVAPRPEIRVSVSIPRMRLRRSVPFLVDTGADQTVLSPDQFQRAGEDFGEAAQPLRGVGGRARRWRAEGVQLRIANPHALLDVTPPRVTVVEGLPVNLLGRDVLEMHGLAMYFHIATRTFSLERPEGVGLAPRRRHRPDERQPAPAGMPRIARPPEGQSP